MPGHRAQDTRFSTLIYLFLLYGFALGLPGSRCSLHVQQDPSLTVTIKDPQYQEQAGFATSSIASRLSCVRSIPSAGPRNHIISIIGMIYYYIIVAIVIVIIVSLLVLLL